MWFASIRQRSRLLAGVLLLVLLSAVAVGIAAVTPNNRPGLLIRAKSAYTITVDDRGYGAISPNPQLFTVTASTVGEAVAAWDKHNGTTTYLADRILPSITTPLDANTQIVIRRSAAARFTLGSVPFEGRTAGNSVGEALAENGLLPAGLDYVVPGENTAFKSNMPIQVVRVRERVESRLVLLPYTTRIQSDATLPAQVRKAIQLGITGLAQENVMIRTEDGVEIMRGLPYQVILRAPVDLVISVGSP